MKPCRLDELSVWLSDELNAIPVPYQEVIRVVAADLDSFVEWPERAELLWPSCDRSLRYHRYPQALVDLIRERKIPLDCRSNGPAVVAYQIAGGKRPARAGRHLWTIHHLYDGNFAYPGSQKPGIRAVRKAKHFTQSAGLVAIHPVADALASEFEAFAWRLRAEAFNRFCYDPEGAFTLEQDEFGFSGRYCTKVWAPPEKSSDVVGASQL